MSNVLFEVKDHVGIITINRPKALNALNQDVMKELDEIVKAADANDDVYVMIITGAGEKSFVAGADIGFMSNMTSAEGKAWGLEGNRVFLDIENAAKPVIAAINGFALGGGCELAMACDIRVASDNARFAQPEVGLGITPGFGGTQRMPRLLGRSKAMELILTTRQIKAAEAKEIGLVSQVVPQEELMDTAMKLAHDICKNAQVAVRQAKSCINRGLQTDIVTGTAFEAEAFGLCFSTEDQKDAMLAFVEKRKLDGFKNR